MKTLFSILILLFFVSCSDKKIVKKTDQQLKYSFDNILSYYSNEDTLFIKSRFADCGEWGGHEELIKIYRSERKIKLVYTKYKVDCGNRDKTGSIIQNQDITNNLTLSNSQQASVMNYMNNLMKLKFINPEFSNSRNSFSVEDSREKLKLSQYGNNTHLLRACLKIKLEKFVMGLFSEIIT